MRRKDCCCAFAFVFAVGFVIARVVAQFLSFLVRCRCAWSSANTFGRLISKGYSFMCQSVCPNQHCFARIHIHMRGCAQLSLVTWHTYIHEYMYVCHGWCHSHKLSAIIFLSSSFPLSIVIVIVICHCHQSTINNNYHIITTRSNKKLICTCITNELIIN